MGGIIPLHGSRYPKLAFNGGPESRELEKHSRVCTKGTEPLAPRGRQSLCRFRRLKLVIVGLYASPRVNAWGL